MVFSTTYLSFKVETMYRVCLRPGGLEVHLVGGY